MLWRVPIPSRTFNVFPVEKKPFALLSHLNGAGYPVSSVKALVTVEHDAARIDLHWFKAMGA